MLNLILCIAIYCVIPALYYSYVVERPGVSRVFQPRAKLSGRTRLQVKNDANSQSGNRRGYYVRPSSAIERGGGFFIPGLEGASIRIASSALLIVLFVINSFGNTRSDLNFSISSTTGVLMAVLLSLQGISSVLTKPDLAVQDNNKFLSVLQSNVAANEKTTSVKIRAVAQSIEGLVSVLVLDKEFNKVTEIGPISKPPAIINANIINVEQISTGLTVIKVEEMNKTYKGAQFNFPTEVQSVVVYKTKNSEEVWCIAMNNNNINIDKIWLETIIDGII